MEHVIQPQSVLKKQAQLVEIVQLGKKSLIKGCINNKK